jgi:hypothetical protein
MSEPLADAAAVRRALARRDLKFGLSVDEAMVIVGPVLEARDAEIARLRAETGSEEKGAS